MKAVHQNAGRKPIRGKYSTGARCSLQTPMATLPGHGTHPREGGSPRTGAGAGPHQLHPPAGGNRVVAKLSLLLDIEDTKTYLDRAFRWQAFYNLYRPHYGAGMNGRTPVEKLRKLGLAASDTLALPPVVLDSIASQIITQGRKDV